MELKNKKWSHDEFFAMRKEILAQWPTGAEVDFDEAVKYHETIPARKHFSKQLIKAKKEGRTLTQPRAGVALLDQQIGFAATLAVAHEHLDPELVLAMGRHIDLRPVLCNAQRIEAP